MIPIASLIHTKKEIIDADEKDVTLHTENKKYGTLDVDKKYGEFDVHKKDILPHVHR